MCKEYCYGFTFIVIYSLESCENARIKRMRFNQRIFCIINVRSSGVSKIFAIIATMDLHGKNVVITGAGGGIGRELIAHLSKEGANVYSIVRTHVDEISTPQYYADLSQKTDVMRVIDQINIDLSHIDILINLAGIGIYKSIQEVSIDEWDESIATKVTAPFMLIKGLLQKLEQARGLVVNVGSGAGIGGQAGRLLYCSSKFALRGLSLSLSQEFKEKYPRFCLLTLGSTLTSFGVGNVVTLEQKIERNKLGQRYFTVEWVVQKLISMLKDPQLEPEVVLFPAEYTVSN